MPRHRISDAHNMTEVEMGRAMPDFHLSGCCCLQCCELWMTTSACLVYRLVSSDIDWSGDGKRREMLSCLYGTLWLTLSLLRKMVTPEVVASRVYTERCDWLSSNHVNGRSYKVAKCLVIELVTRKNEKAKISASQSVFVDYFAKPLHGPKGSSRYKQI